MSQFTKEEQDKIFLALSKNFNIDINCIFYQLVRDTSSPTSYECFCIRGVNFNHVYFSSFNDIPLCFEECCFEFINFNIKEVKNVCFFRKCKLNTITALGVKFGHFFEISDCNIDKLNFYRHSEFYTYARIYSNKINEILLYYIKFHKVDFSKNIFLKPFTPHNVEFLDNVKFDFCSFQDQVSFYKVSFGKNVRFSDAYFNKKSIFSRAYFKKDVYFNNVKFLSGVNFKESSFFGKAYFSFANFGEVNFSKAIFYDIANFYNTIFSETPNFSQAIFKGNLNAVNTNLNFDFENLEKKINQECEEFNKKEQNKKSLDKFANDFRDSFRVFKNALIKDNNLLDASNFHKCELYCKEIELKQSWNKLKNVTTDEDIKQNNRNHSQLVDFLLLGFYRKLCDHHTDFLRVFNNLILLIALYALFIFGFTWLHDDKLKDTRAILTLFGFFDKFEFYFNIGVVICMSFGLILIGKNFIKSFLSILKIFQCLPYIKKWLLKVFKKEIFIKLFSRLKIIILDLCYLMESLVIALLIPCVFYILFAIFDFFLNLDQGFKYLLFVNSLFVNSYICLVYTKSLFFGRYVALILSYVVFFIMLINQPSIILPLIGKFLGDSNGNSNHASLLTLNILYTILMALVLFSLQKTARKNSIVPS
ncbi:pentapeptide repeat-containing protein [Campylobacter molothri]|uniref:pentapeptide repeat-containing protein n=1 Tax=Campylobacter molothri TaxID=1032242 RepID=UPI001ECEDB2F|nr:pentapeptide repeat-containing protein [Campylobacter sp. RM10535]